MCKRLVSYLERHNILSDNQYGFRKKRSTNLTRILKSIAHLHNDVILLLRPESFRVLLSCANLGFCYLILAGIIEFKYGRKNEKDSGPSSEVTPSCKWPIDNNEYTVGVF